MPKTEVVSSRFEPDIVARKSFSILDSGTGTIFDVNGKVLFDDDNDRLTIKDLQDSATVEPFRVEGSRANPSADDAIDVPFRLSDDGGSQSKFAQMKIQAPTITAGSEDGRLQIDVSRNGSLEEAVRFDATETILNEDGADRNFRVESSGDTHAFMVDGGNDNVGIGKTPNFKFEIAGSNDAVLPVNTSQPNMTNADDNSFAFWSNESSNELRVRLKGSGGSVLSGTVSNLS